MPQLKLDLEPESLGRPFAATSTSTQGQPSSSGECSVASINSAEAAFSPVWTPAYQVGRASLFHGDCLDWLADQPANSIHGVVTDPPYGLVEYQPEQQRKLRRGRGGVWRLPPAFDGHQRSPVPRFTTLTASDLDALDSFFSSWADALLPTLVPGAHVLVASNPLLSHRVAVAVCRSGFERRGEVVRLVMTMRGGDRPKNAHEEFPDVTVMPRSKWEPWLLFRKPLAGRVQDNLRKWGTGGLRRISSDRPFGDVIASAPTRPDERRLAPHPSLKPQAFLRQAVRAILPMGEGVVLDPFAGSGSTIAAAEHIGYASTGVESDPEYLQLAKAAIPLLKDYEPCPDSVSSTDPISR
ncbi:MAG: site-specific DNA-methyltransferase [Acidimicrobiia bacterium]|nr:site-specific DNA-methyltransferase [Acidimicrobiia bacterium]MYG73058.1 site-specific DNA-methyltransferase [Acidimicrobiia bacterium]MYH95111.1 site-specific DNA-methyltransferase [Acidimicrobiia bacterium]